MFTAAWGTRHASDAGLIVIGEIVRKRIGYEKLQGIRVCAALMSLVPFGNLAPLY